MAWVLRSCPSCKSHPFIIWLFQHYFFLKKCLRFPTSKLAIKKPKPVLFIFRPHSCLKQAAGHLIHSQELKPVDSLHFLGFATYGLLTAPAIATESQPITLYTVHWLPSVQTSVAACKFYSFYFTLSSYSTPHQSFHLVNCQWLVCVCVCVCWEFTWV